MEKTVQDRVLIIASATAPESMDFKGAGYCVQTPLKGGLRMSERLWRALNMRLNLPFQFKLYNEQYLCHKWELIIVIEGALTTPTYLKWLCKKHPESKVVLLYSNPISRIKSPWLRSAGKGMNPTEISDTRVIPWTFDPSDAKEYGIHHFDAIYVTKPPIPKKEIQYDAVFVGKDKKRAPALRKLEKQMIEMGLKPYIHIVSDSVMKKKGYKPPIPYTEVLELMGASRCVIDYLQAGQTGVSIRTIESMFNGIKVITNSPRVMEMSFYNKNNIFVLGVDSFDTLYGFIKSPFAPIDMDILDRLLADTAMREFLQD